MTSFSHSATPAEKQEVKNGIGGPVAIGKVFVGMVSNGVDVRAVVVMVAMISLSL